MDLLKRKERKRKRNRSLLAVRIQRKKKNLANRQKFESSARNLKKK